MSDAIEQALREGIAAIKRGDKAAAREHLFRVLEQDDKNEHAWLWMSAAVEEREDRIIALENVLTINPNNTHARKGLAKLGITPTETEPQPEAWREEVTQPKVKEEPNPILERAEKRRERKQKRQEVLAAVPRGEERDIFELFNAWFAALTFQERHLIAEMKAADPLRVLINILFAMLIAGGLGITAFIVVTNNPLPAEFEMAYNEFSTSYQANTGEPFPFTLRQTVNTLMGIASFSTIIGVFINGVVLSITTHVGARMLGADGEFIQTAHAVTIAMVAQQIVGIVPNLATTLLGVGGGIVSILLFVYIAAVAAVTLSAAHTDFDYLKSIGAYVGGAIVGVIAVFACTCAFTFLLTILAR